MIHPWRLSSDSFRLVEQMNYMCSKAVNLKRFIHVISMLKTLHATHGIQQERAV